MRFVRRIPGGVNAGSAAQRIDFQPRVVGNCGYVCGAADSYRLDPGILRKALARLDGFGNSKFGCAVNAPGKRYVQLAEGTHTIVMEKNRMKLFEAVQAFLDESER